MKSITLNYKPANKLYSTINICKLTKNDFGLKLHNAIVLLLNYLEIDHLEGKKSVQELFNNLDNDSRNIEYLKNISNDKKTANLWYRLQSNYTTKTPNGIHERLIEWKLNSLEGFSKISSGFEAESFTKQGIEELLDQGLTINIVTHVDFSYLGPYSSLGTLTTKTGNVILKSEKFKDWPMFIHCQFSNFPNKEKKGAEHDPGCFYKPKSSFGSNMSLRVFVTDDQEKRILENYKDYFPAGTNSIRPPNKQNYSGVFLSLPSGKSTEQGNKDLNSVYRVNYFINPECLGAYNENTMKFENKNLRKISDEKYNDEYVYNDINCLKKYAYLSGFHDIKDIEDYDLEFELDTQESINKAEKYLCEVAAKKYSFKDLESFFNFDKFEDTQHDNLILAQNCALMKCKTKDEKEAQLKKYISDRYKLDRSKLTHLQARFIAIVEINYSSFSKVSKETQEIIPPQPNFKLISIACTGTSSF
jgi:hypothetical protein